MKLFKEAAKKNNMTVDPAWKAPTESKGQMVVEAALGRRD